ncbi:MAG: 16S rRNA (cytosine(1402)-N(4))-methyltransferase, partial [Rubrivivax sp.]|nr:16S rRNA (cytosine(1402)-N(4))-methyltransferase [Rubrivivax sp.]
MNSAGAWSHTTVLLPEAVQALVTQPAGTYVDGTFGRGGHARAVLAALAPQGRLIAFDRDLEAVAAAALIDDPRFSIHHGNFGDMAPLLRERGITQV